MAIVILHFIHPLFEDNGFSRVMVSQKCLDSAKDQCLNHTFTSGTSEGKTANDKEAQLEDCKVGAGDWLAQNFKAKTLFWRTARFTGQQCPVNQRK